MTVTERQKMENDTLGLTDFDRDFLRQLKIGIPEDVRWEVDAEEIDTTSLRELFESCLQVAE